MTMTFGPSPSVERALHSGDVSLPATMTPRLSDIDWRWALPRILLVFLVTRLMVVVVIAVTDVTYPELAPPEHLVSDDRPLVSTLTAYDGVWYRGIAEDGYHAEIERYPDYAFYPLYPLAIRAASLLTLGDSSLATLLVSNLAFLVALFALYALSVRYLAPDRAMLGLWLLGLAPGAVAFTLAYTESLFLLLAVAAFLAAELRRHWLAGILVALATLARPTGILLVLPLALLYLQRSDWRPTRALFPLVVAPLAWLVWFVYVWWMTGDPMATFDAQSYWDPAAYAASRDEVGSADPRFLPQGPAVLLYLLVILFYFFSLVWVQPDRFPHAYRLVVVVFIGSLLLAGRADSAVRDLAVAWPTYWGVAIRESALGRAAVLALFTASQVFLLWYIATWNWLP